MKKITYTIRQTEEGGLRIDGELVSVKVKNGICCIANHSTGGGHSCHPNIASTGSVKGMKKMGYWGKTDSCVRANGFIYNKSVIHCSDTLDYIALAIEYSGLNEAMNPTGGNKEVTRTLVVQDNNVCFMEA